MFTIFIVALALLFFFVIYLYNRLVGLRVRVKEAWSDIEVQLKRRHNLIPNLVETVKGYAGHEKGVFEKVTEARAKALNAQTPKELGAAENMLTGALKSLFAVAEAYPDLKASSNFVELQRELTDTEDKIQAARRFYNANVRDYNTAIALFPANMMAQMFGFKASEFFEVEEEEVRSVPVVKF
ncbi:MAG: hypothetical protein A2806_02295 [Candidatus Terrybacteria bacterium RIFCSPHIGHO2_01_FULL_48_17]|uniref:LemA family protein n=1 Tax=Candidatus Terrybacteria bacterium RIFCSPHIGHO2_01_FULL_48_17 TaxID=1802362 RepID=A0A1G2PJM9_9BACT|nr:MAG: hypothetical protein A2806_02295 [Candidatus Terrybacteria bacterium RIFCSPHIGHO2_01_FULL_48_17]OHA53575.1 MAG: hypothetical protein A3A30_00250 [Candidatus Terrybacteria bacterium RIFCSPLOWO2_01_FULL_48_14]